MNKTVSMLTVAVGLVTLTSFGNAAQAQTPATAQTNAPAQNNVATSGSLTVLEQRFLKSAAMKSLYEIDLSNLAKTKSKREDIRQLADQMIYSHQGILDNLGRIAKSRGFSLPGSLDNDHQIVHDRLVKETGGSFDGAYLREQIHTHDLAIAMYQNAVANAKAPEIVAFAKEQLPTLQTQQAAIAKLPMVISKPQPGPGKVSAYSAKDIQFLKSAAMKSLYEIDLSNLAMNKSKREDIRQLADQMIYSHRVILDNLDRIARSAGVQFPNNLDNDHLKVHDRLVKETGGSFDGDYLREQIHTHDLAIAMYQGAIDSGKSPAVIAFAKEQLPTLQTQQAAIAKLPK